MVICLSANEAYLEGEIFVQRVFKDGLQLLVDLQGGSEVASIPGAVHTLSGKDGGHEAASTAHHIAFVRVHTGGNGGTATALSVRLSYTVVLLWVGEQKKNS